MGIVDRIVWKVGNYGLIYKVDLMNGFTVPVHTRFGCKFPDLFRSTISRPIAETALVPK